MEARECLLPASSHDLELFCLFSSVLKGGLKIFTKKLGVEPNIIPHLITGV